MAETLGTFDRMRIEKPNAALLILAVFVCAFTYLTTAVIGLYSSDALPQRICFLAGLVLTCGPVLESARRARGPKGQISDPHSWIYAFYMGVFWLLAVALMVGTASNVNLWAWGIGAVVFGGLLGFSPLGNVKPQTLRSLDTPSDRRLTDKSWGKLLYFCWPFIYIALMALLLVYPPKNGWTDGYFMFQAVLLLGPFPLYQRVSNSNWLWFGPWPGGLGIAFLVVGLLAF